MPRERPAAEIMTTDVLTLRPDMSVEEAIADLAGRGISGAPVIDDEDRYIGLLDDSDLILSEARVHAPSAIEILGAYFPLPGSRHRFEEEVRHALGTTVADLMSTDAPTASSTATVEDVATLMTSHHVSRVPIVDADRRVIGIVSRGDLVTAMVRRED